MEASDVFEVMIQETFSAAHRLLEYGGKCENLHGHNWRIDVVVRAENPDELGLVMDFRTLKENTREVLAELDHAFLNELPAFRDRNPSSEYIAKYIFEKLTGKLSGEAARIARVSVWESDHACATYLGETA
jgi:6-pyruvoyltetrahydropterin/6-carboxytetrahydropterin synthase